MNFSLHLEHWRSTGGLVLVLVLVLACDVLVLVLAVILAVTCTVLGLVLVLAVACNVLVLAVACNVLGLVAVACVVETDEKYNEFPSRGRAGISLCLLDRGRTSLAVPYAPRKSGSRLVHIPTGIHGIEVIVLEFLL